MRSKKSKSILLLGALILLIAVLYITTKNSRSAAESLGVEFCACMHAENSSEDYYQARKICDTLLVQKYEYYKILRVDYRDTSLKTPVPYELSRKVGAFFKEYYDYTKEHCCDAGLNCPPDTLNK